MRSRAMCLSVALLLLAPVASGSLPLFAPPFAEFHWTPGEPHARDRVLFQSVSRDPDGVILFHAWTFPWREDTVYGPQPEVDVGPRGIHPVTLRVWDATLLESRVTRLVSVLGVPPVPSIEVEPDATFRGVPTSFLGDATDADGDAITAWTWLIDGEELDGQNVTRIFAELGNIEVQLRVTDAGGMDASALRIVRVQNRPPVVAGEYEPSHPWVGAPVTFAGTGHDPDVPDGTVALRWQFSDGVTLEGPTVERSFTTAGDHSVTLRGTDADGGVSEPFVIAFHVDG